jgi:hypothetical protein
LARNFRWYEKKRGNRRTGSRVIGRAGELIFFVALLVLGLGGSLRMVTRVIVPEWRANHEFAEQVCVVLAAQIAEREGEDGTLYRPEIQIEYEVEGVTYRPWTYDIGRVFTSGREPKEAIVAEFAVGQRYPCWYDPLDPNVAVLVRGYSWWMWPLTLVSAALVLVGAGGLLYTWLHWGKSAERRAAIARRVQEGELFRGNGKAPRSFPNVPDGADIGNSPGTRLKFRLPIGTSSGWLLVVSLATCLLWNGMVAVWSVLAVRGFRSGEPDWALAIFLLPFAAVGMGLAYWFVRNLLVATGIGPTTIEVSDHPLRPGSAYQLFLAQTGRLTIEKIEVTLTCWEEATFRQGTNTRTESRAVLRLPLLVREHFEVQHGVPFEALCEFTVPPGAMHSFRADHNAITWKVEVAGCVAGWPDYKRSFHVVVCPGRHETP